MPATHTSPNPYEFLWEYGGEKALAKKNTSGVFGRKGSECDAWHFLMAPVLSVDLKLEGWELSHLYMSLLSVLQKIGMIHNIFLRACCDNEKS